MSTKKCEICDQDFNLKTNRLGLVIDDHHFICESCNLHIQENECEQIPISVMHSEVKQMPIALWLIQE
ncbi:MAG: hypothetical protein QCI00_09035, partial [Candidatus Thermoplasmatota archaeon]|nr:hypothetical protein [Candidatus Thermoplasmatota archaeon]